MGSRQRRAHETGARDRLEHHPAARAGVADRGRARAARHLHSEEEMKGGKSYAHYCAVVGVLTMKSELLGRGAVEAEFRSANDLFDRIGGGNGPAGLKAVAPAGREQVTIEVPPTVDQVS